MVLYGMRTLQERSDARRLLAAAVKEEWNMDALPAIQIHALGKPYFPAFPGHQFNLSHSGSYALCGLDASPVGVDLQILKSWRPRLPQRVCSQNELTWLNGQPDRQKAFVILWSLKEARVKQSGVGIRSDLREIAVPLPEAWTGPVLFDGLWFRAYPEDGWAAAACGQTQPPEEIQWLTVV